MLHISPGLVGVSSCNCSVETWLTGSTVGKAQSQHIRNAAARIIGIDIENIGFVHATKSTFRAASCRDCLHLPHLPSHFNFPVCVHHNRWYLRSSM